MMQISSPVPSMAKVAPDAPVPFAVEGLVARLLAKDPADRFASADEVSVRLTEVIGELVAQGRIDPDVVDRAGVSGPVRSVASPIAHAVIGTAPTRLALGPAATRAPIDDILDLLRPLRARVASTSGRARARLAASPSLRAALAASVGVLVLGLLGAGLAVWAGGNEDRPAASQERPGGAASVATGSPEAPALGAQLAAAEAALDRGDFGTAVGQLTVLELGHPESAAVHRDLERAYTGTGDVKGALREARAWLAAAPATGRDAKFEEDVRNAALGTVAPDDAFALLETGMGTAGADILYDLAYGAAADRARAATDRARAALADATVRRNASAALAVTLDLRAARTCEAKKALLDRARDSGDSRTAAVLKPLKSTSGCGFIGRRDCWPCLHRDGALAAAIEASDGHAP
jgi:hypothetical protein